MISGVTTGMETVRGDSLLFGYFHHVQLSLQMTAFTEK